MESLESEVKTDENKLRETEVNQVREFSIRKYEKALCGFNQEENVDDQNYIDLHLNKAISEYVKKEDSEKILELGDHFVGRRHIDHAESTYCQAYLLEFGVLPEFATYDGKHRKMSKQLHDFLEESGRHNVLEDLVSEIEYKMEELLRQVGDSSDVSSVTKGNLANLEY